MSTLLEKKVPVSAHYSYNVWDTIVSTILTFVCVISFKPSFISEISLAKQLIIAGIISGVVLSVLLVKCYIVYKLENADSWTLKMDLISLFSVFIVISSLLLALSPLVLKTWLKLPLPIDGEYVLIVFGFVHLIGLLLYFVSVSAKYIVSGSPSRVEENVASPSEPSGLSTTDAPIQIILQGKNKGEHLSIDKNNLISISTNGHYIDIFLVDPENDKPQKVVFRNTILSVMDSLKEYDEFVHCHRSHLINLNQVESISGTVKKMEVRFSHHNVRIPVSRAKAPSLHEKWRELKK